MPYETPGSDIVAIVDAPATPLAMLAPGGRFMALVHYEPHPPISLLARPYLPLAGLRIDPVLGGRQRVRRLTGLSILRLADGTQRPLPLPADAQVSVPTWAPDGRRLAFTVDQGDGIGVWVADAGAGTAGQVPGLVVRDVLGGDPLTPGAAAWWSRDGQTLLALGAPGEQAAVRQARSGPRIDGPHIEETAGKRSQMATFMPPAARSWRTPHRRPRRRSRSRRSAQPLRPKSPNGSSRSRTASLNPASAARRWKAKPSGVCRAMPSKKTPRDCVACSPCA